MNRLTLTTITGLALAASAALQAQSKPAGAAVAPASRTVAGEPRVEHIVVEDNGARVEELRVRGTTQRVVVTPKVGTTQSYEIIMGDGSRDLSPGANTSRGAAGKRVWHVLSF
jgi:hypothetical protein